MNVRVSIAILVMFFAAMHAFVLKPEGFFSGDQGPKYLQARAFAEHGPFHPGIDVAARDIDPEYRFHEPILRNRGGQLVATFSWLLPLLSAPFVGVADVRGLAIVPAISAILIFIGAAALGRRFGERAGSAAGWTAVLAAPTLFYGLEHWEHAPAAACAMAVVLLLTEDPTPGHAFAAGACASVAGLFREEAALVLPAFIGARLIVCADPAERRRVLRAAAWSVAGAAAVFALSVPGNLIVYGSALPLHFTSELQKTTSYWPARAAIVQDVFLTAWTPDSIWCTWPFVFALAALPFTRVDDHVRKTTRYVAIGACLCIAGAVAIVPSTGGAQWGPRYLFVAAPLLAAVVSIPARGGPLRWPVRVLLALALCAQIVGVRHLATSKSRHARIADALASRAAPGDVVITDIPWFPEIAARLAPTRRMLFSWSSGDVPEMAALAIRHDIPRVDLVTLVPQTGYDAPPAIDVPGTSCRLVRGRQFGLDELGLTLSRYSCESQ